MGFPRQNSDDLIRAKRGVTVPFCLSVNVDNETLVDLHVTRLFRLLPGKRLVVLASRGNTQFVLKVFLGRTARKYYSQELDGIMAIADLNIPTPALRWKGRLKDGKGYVLALEYLDGCEDMESAWLKTASLEGKTALLADCLQIFATMHSRGIRQKDIHLNNFVIYANAIYAIDGGGMCFSSSPQGLDREKSLNNLARFFAQFKPANDPLVHSVYPAYARARGWAVEETCSTLLQKRIVQKRQERKVHYLAKTLRDCSRFLCEKNLTRFLVCERSCYSDTLKTLLARPDEFIEAAREKGEILKEGNSATVALVHTSERSLVVKRYNPKSGFGILRKALKPSRARNSWVQAHQLDFLGIASIKPVAVLEKRLGPFVSQAYFISEYVEGINMDECYSQGSSGQTKVNGDSIKGILNILDALKLAKVTHGDLKATNFRYSENGLVLLDLDSMRNHKDNRAFKKAFAKDINRFLDNWKSRPEIYGKFKSATDNLIAAELHQSGSDM